MFERRLKIFLGILLIFTLVLVVRAFQVQVVQQSVWKQEADKFMRRPVILETTRGRITDVRGREVAVEVASIDACVDYRAITKEPSAKWIRTMAADRVVSRLG